MAIANPNTVIDHSSDAGFRAWALEHRNLLLTGGALVQTADTGQIDFGTATRPAINTDAAPAIFRFDDALQAAAPWFLAVYYGTGTAVDRPRIRIAIGTGTNGAGVLTGVVLSATIINNTAAVPSTSTLYESAACGLPGSICVAHKMGWSATTSLSLLGIHRTRSHAGAQTDEGLAIYTVGAGSALECRSIRRVSPTVFGPSNVVCMIPLGTTSSVISGGERQCYAHSTAIPEVRPVIEYITVAAGEFSAGVTPPARPPGASADRTYLCLGPRINQPGAGAGSGTHALCILWE